LIAPRHSAGRDAGAPASETALPASERKLGNFLCALIHCYQVISGGRAIAAGGGDFEDSDFGVDGKRVVSAGVYVEVEVRELRSRLIG